MQSSIVPAALLFLGSTLAWWVRPPPPPPIPTYRLTVGGGSISGPDSTGSGWTRLRVEEDGAGHIVVVFRMPAAATDADVKQFLVALDTAPGSTPPPAIALGGPEVGDTGEVVIDLAPGSYVAGCVRRGSDGHRHASAGEAKLFRVTALRTAGAGAPVATDSLGMVDFAYLGTDRWPAGRHSIRVENRGRQDHQVRIGKLRSGVSVSEWMQNPALMSQAVAGVARLGAGRIAYLEVELPPGEYVFYCLVSDAGSGKQHVQLGMLRAIHVE